MKKSTTRVTLVSVFLVMLVVGYFAYLTNRDRRMDTSGNMTPVESVLSRNMEYNYPPTPKEVLKYYNEIVKCLYNEDCTDEEIEQLGRKARELYDDELLANNEWEGYIDRLKAEVAEYKKKKRKITNFSVSASTDVKEYTVDGYSFARLLSAYNILEGSTSKPVTEVFVLRRDEEKHWKIYGWDLAQNLENNQEDNRENDQ